VPIYELACEGGHRSETLRASTRKVPSGSGAAGTAAVPPPERRDREGSAS
jgi:hypothetical protein